MAQVKMPEKYTGDNSNQARNTNASTRSSKPVTKGKMRSKPLGRKFAEVFFEGTFNDAVDYMINDVAIPQLKNAVLKGIEVIFYGGVNGSSSRTSGGSNTPYSSYYVARDGSRRQNSVSNGKQTSSEISKLRKSYDPRDIIVEDRGLAQRVLADLRRDCDEFGQIGVDRLFELVDIPSDWTSTKYGWVKGMLDGAKVKPCGSGWWFDLPEPILID